MMQVGFQVEEIRTDGFALRLLLQRILGVEVTPVFLEHRAGGIQACLATVRNAYCYFHYRTDAIGGVFCIDNDGKPRHARNHTDPSTHLECRFCMLMEKVREAAKYVTSRPTDPQKMLHVIAVPVEAIEAWALYGAHLAGGKQNRHPETVDKSALKQTLYGETHPESHVQRQKFEKIFASDRLDLGRLSAASPSFAFFVEQVAEWRRHLPASNTSGELPSP